MVEGVKRTIVGTILYVLGILYYAFYPIIMIGLLLSVDDIPATIGSLSWPTYLAFSLMVFFAIILIYSLFRPLSRLTRIISGLIFLAGVIVFLAEVIYDAAVHEVYNITIGTNTIYSALIGIGMLLGYESKLAFLLLPFRAKKADGESSDRYASP